METWPEAHRYRGTSARGILNPRESWVVPRKYGLSSPLQGRKGFFCYPFPLSPSAGGAHV